MAAPLPVGEFSRITHLSVKTLRHYHQVGLLESAEVNPDTGYRYYTLEQIPTVQVIRRLRALEMPVSDVKAVLAAPDAAARNALIAAHLDRLEKQLAQTYAAVDSLRNLLKQPGGGGGDAPDRSACAGGGIAQNVGREDILPWWQGALGELHATVRAQGLRPAGPAGGLFASELFTRDRGDATVFVPVAADVRAVGRVTPRVIPAAELAVATHHGSLDDIDVTYGRLGSYVTAHEIGVDGPLREYYLAGERDTRDQDQWHTEIAWPFFRAA